MLKTFSFYHKATGELHTSYVAFDVNGNHAALALKNGPADHAPIEGSYDRLSQRVDLSTGKVMDYQPPQPSPEHEWNVATRRWQLSATAQEKLNKRQAALVEIARLVASQHDAVREMLLNVAGARERLQGIQDQIAALRAQL